MSDVTPPNSAAGDPSDSHRDRGQIRLRRDVAENQLGLLRHCAICGRTASMLAQVSLDLPRLPANKRSSKPDARNRGADWCVGTGCDTGCDAGCSGLPELAAFEGPGCLIAIGVALVLLLFLVVVRLIQAIVGRRRLRGTPVEGKPITWVDLQIPVCFRHWLVRFRPPRLIRSGPTTVLLGGLAGVFVEECRQAGLEVKDPGLGEVDRVG